MSGIEPSPELFNLFNEMKLRSKFKYVTFSLVPSGVDANNKKVWGWAINDTVAASGQGAAGQINTDGVSGGSRAPTASASDGEAPAVRSTPGASPLPNTPARPVAAASAQPRAGTVSSDDNAGAWKEMVAHLPEGEGRFVLFDWRAKAPDGRILAKVLLVKWCPDTVEVQQKMLMGSSYQKLKDKLLGLGRDIQASDPADLEYNVVKPLVGEA